MKNYTMFDFNLLFGDHFAKVSNQAKLYYIKLNFYADHGFVANPLSVLDSLGFDKSVFQELINNGEILSLPDRCEVFITSYFVHNNKFKPSEWLKSPFAVYWKGKLWTKKNGVATFKPQGEEVVSRDPLDIIVPPTEVSTPTEVPQTDWDKLFDGDDEAVDSVVTDNDLPF